MQRLSRWHSVNYMDTLVISTTSPHSSSRLSTREPPVCSEMIISTAHFTSAMPHKRKLSECPLPASPGGGEVALPTCTPREVLMTHKVSLRTRAPATQSDTDIPVSVQLRNFPRESSQAGNTIDLHQIYGCHGKQNSQNSLLFFNSHKISLRNGSLKGFFLALGHLFTGPKGFGLFVTLLHFAE